LKQTENKDAKNYSKLCGLEMFNQKMDYLYTCDLNNTRMALSRVNTSAKAADVAKLLLLDSSRATHTGLSLMRSTTVPPPSRNRNPTPTLT